MKKTFLAGLAAGLMTVGMAGIAQAYFISDGTDVGFYDLLSAETNQKIINTFNGDPDGKVLAWVNSLLDPDTTFAFKNDPLNYAEFQDIFLTIGDTPVAGGYAFELTTNSPEYFLIKTGGGITDDKNSYFLFENNINMQWAVFDLASMGFTTIDNIQGISHIDEYGGGNPVPEPSTMLLIGTGLAGLIAVRRKKKA